MSSAHNLARRIDHTLLKPEATEAQILTICDEALEHHFFGVCINSFWVPLASRKLSSSAVRVVAVVGFPLGAAASESKVFETSWAVQNGAQEVDTVLNIGALKSGKTQLIESELKNIVSAAQGNPVKLILETHLLLESEMKLACLLAENAGVAFIKTSTGFSGGGARVEDISKIRAWLSPQTQIKASGGIRSLEDALALLEAGATRLGTSSGVALVTSQKISGVEY